MATETVVIGCRDAARAEALTRAVAARSLVAVVDAWPLELAVAAGIEADTSVVVLDGFPSGPVLRTMADVTASRPELNVLVLGPLEPNVDILIALACGAFGYLPSSSTPAVVATAVDALLAGDAVLPRAVSSPLIQHLRSGGRGIVVGRPDGQTAALTTREWEVFVLLRQHRSTAEMARHLVVSKVTIRTHVAALMHKLGVHNRFALAASGTGDNGRGRAAGSPVSTHARPTDGRNPAQSVD